VRSGAGKIRVSGTVHSLVVTRGVEVILDNVSPSLLDPELFLYVRDGSVFDAIINYKDGLSQSEINTLIARPLDNPTTTPTDVPHVWKRSTIKNLYCHDYPVNYRTAEIQNIILFPQA
jgi:hypothetical protein